MDDSTSEEPTARFSVRLRTSHRMRSDRAGGRHILEVARAINDGAADALLGEELALPRTTLEESFEREGVCLVPLEGARVRGALRSFVELWFERYIASAPGFDDADRPLDYDEDEGFEPGELERVSALYDGLLAARVLCLTRVRATGSRALDEAFVERTSTYRTGSARGHDPFLPGTPVMMLRNDYERNIFNGDQGVIWPVRLDGRVEKMAIFPRAETFVPFHLGGLRGTLEPSYAMTVHKSQGSEFRHVALVLPDEPLPLLTRELLYTAVTRSSHSVAILGDEQMLHTGVCRRMERFSRLGDKLDRFFGEDVEALP
jgi:exodeoxyribonuclease V alpha subunit